MFPSPLMTQEASYRTDVRLPLQPVRYQQYIPADAPQGMSYVAFLRSWTDDHVARWLHDIKCASHQDTFRANDIRGDVLLDLDQKILQEMGVASIGDRLRILNAVKVLRQKVSGKSPALHKPSSTFDVDRTDSSARTVNRRLENFRPAPLLLTANAGRGDLPAIQRDPDSARGSFQQQPQPTVRPLPTMPLQSTPPSNGTPSSAQSTNSVSRSNLPPLPAPSRPPPPPPPSGQVRPNLSPDIFRGSPSAANTWVNQHLPADPRPGNPGSRRAISPLPQAHPRPNQGSGLQRSHARSGSSGNPAPISPTKRLPVANQAPTGHHPLPSHLSPIDEVFSSAGSNTPSPPTVYRVGSGPFNTPPSGPGPSSLDDLRKRLVKFIIPDEGLTFTIDVASCNGGVEVVEKVLKKFVKNNYRADTSDVSQTEDGGLSVDGWVVYPDLGQGDSAGQPFTEAELLAICLSPDHPLREYGLVLRRIPRTTAGSPPFSSNSQNPKRASSISILSDLGVRNPEHALDVPTLPLPSVSSLGPSGRLSPASHTSNTRRPSKLRNFFGQRPPSELITNHLTEFFPNAEKRVLQRTARNSMMRRRESVVSYKQLSSRFSTSTQGSRISQPPPVPDKGDTEDLPRVSLSTDDGRSVDLHIDSADVRKDTVPHLPPIPFPSAPLSEFIDDVTTDDSQKKRVSRAISTSSKRLSYMTELRSKRDKSDTASLMTVDQITEAVESRRASIAYGREEDLDGWTKVDSEIESMVPTAVADDDGAVDEEEEDEDDSEISDEEDETLNDDAAELGLDLDDDGLIRNVMSAKRANKWIKGALIGAGSFGKVYLGMDASSGLLMAVKQVELPTGSAPNQERKKSMLTALEREIELLQTLQHDNIVQYLYSSIDDEFLNIFLEYVPGGSVSALLRNYGAFEEPLVKNFVRQISQGLSYLHERDIIHRDIKGANILVDNKGGVKISDFGISKKVDTLLTGNKTNRPSLQGSVFWMAPEVVKQSGHTHKADIWSVGCLIVEMLTGEHPWAQLTQMQAIFRIGSSATPTIPSDISSDAQDFLKHTFRVDHEARPSAAELLQHPWIASKT